MRLGVLKKLLRGDLAKAGGDLPKWIDTMLPTINSFFEKVGQALEGRLTFEDNFMCKRIDLEFTHGVEQLINPESVTAPGARVVGVLPVLALNQVIDKFGWIQKESGNIGATFYFDGGTSATKAKCRLYILLGGS